MLWNEFTDELLAFCVLKQPLLFPTAEKVIKDVLGEYNGEVDSKALTKAQKKFLANFSSALKLKNSEKKIECYPDQPVNEYFSKVLALFEKDLLRFFQRKGLILSLTFEEKKKILFQMKLTRSVDERGEAIYMSGPLYNGTPFGGKGFKSSGQEAICAAALRLNRDRSSKKEYAGDLVGPMIRDLGVCLMMGMKVEWVYYAQLGKNGPPMYGKDLHIGDLQQGVYPPTAPLAMTIQANVGAALAFKQRKEKRIVVNFSGDGATSLGEWHTAINFAAVQKLPIVFVVQDNQVALSTWKESQCAATTYADKGIGYGIPSIVIDGNDPEAIFSAVTEAADYARAGNGPTLIEMKTMRMSGHAFHDTPAYLAGRKQKGKLVEPPYVRQEIYDLWKERDPICRYTEKLKKEGLLENELETMTSEIQTLVDQAEKKVLESPWPTPSSVDLSVFAP